MQAEEVVLTCGRCKATYKIDVKEFGTGRYVKCTNCDHEWYQSEDRLRGLPEGMKLVEYPAEMKERLNKGLSAMPTVGFRAFVGNLAFSANEESLKELFGQYGTVVNVNIMLGEDGRPRGLGFVNMESAEDGAKAGEQ